MQVNRLLEEKGVLVSKLKAMNDQAETTKAATLGAAIGGGAEGEDEGDMTAATLPGVGVSGQQTEQFQTQYSQVGWCDI